MNQMGLALTIFALMYAGGDDGHVPAKGLHSLRMQAAQTRKASMSGMPYGHASDEILGEVTQPDGR